MEKNSFSLLETVLSLLILSILVSGFIQFTYNKPTHTFFINQIQNLLTLKQPHEKINTAYIQNSPDFSNISLPNSNAIIKKTYQSDALKLEYFELQHTTPQNISFEVLQ